MRTHQWSRSGVDPRGLAPSMSESLVNAGLAPRGIVRSCWLPEDRIDPRKRVFAEPRLPLLPCRLSWAGAEAIAVAAPAAGSWVPSSTCEPCLKFGTAARHSPGLRAPSGPLI